MKYFNKLCGVLLSIAVFLPKLEGVRLRLGIRRGLTLNRQGVNLNGRGPLYILYPRTRINYEDGYVNNFQSGTQYADEVPAEIDSANHDQVDSDFGSNITLTCTARGFPRPTITWWKDGKKITPEKYNQIYTSLKLYWKRATIEISPGTDEDVGYYECCTSNVFGDDSRAFQIDYVSICDDPCDGEPTKRLSVINSNNI